MQWRIAAVVGVALASAGPVLAVAPADAEANLPLTIDDAAVAAPGELEIHGAAMVDRYSGADAYSFLTGLSYGLVQAVELSAGLEYDLGRGEEGDSGELQLGAQYQFVRESDRLPAVAAAAEWAQGFGDSSGDSAVDVRLLAAKRIGFSELAPRLYVNFGWRHEFDREVGARANVRTAALGWSQPIDPRFAVLADLAWEESGQRDQGGAVLAGLGGRYRLGRRLVAAAGLAAGLNANAPDLRLTVGLQQGF